MSQFERLEEFVRQRSGEVIRRIERQSAILMPAIESQLAEGFRSSAVAGKVFWLRQAARTLARVADGVAACRDGCAACCHIPVMLLSSEASVIGQEIGITPADVPLEKRNIDPPRWRGAGHACPFLKDSRCSIYESRPLACRGLFNLDKDAYLCQHEDEVAQVPYMDTCGFDVNAVRMLGGDAVYIAELRDFFPKAA